MAIRPLRNLSERQSLGSPPMPGEQMVRVSDQIELCYETFGDASDPTALLVMGLATQMIAWPTEFCEQLAARGLPAGRFANRAAAPPPNRGGPQPKPLELITRSKKPARYTLNDMSDDA